MSKEKEKKKDSPEQDLVEELKATRKKAKGVAENEEVDPLEEARAQKKVAEEVDTEAIPVIELKKGLKPRQTPEAFDWDSVTRKGVGKNYTPEQRAELEKMYTGSIANIQSGEVVTGTIVGINDRDVILNIGFKSDGLVPLAEFKDSPDIKIGDQVEVFVEEREDKLGQLILSRRKARLFKGWQKIQQALDEDTVIEGFVKRRTKGGLIVDVYGIEAFLPGSQIDVKPIRDFDIYVGKAMEVKVVKINYANNNVVVSHKVLIEKDIEEQKAAILRNLEKGQVLEGTIKNMTNFGVFIDLGGVDGLLHITDISWGRVNHPEEVLKLDQVVKVVVLDFDEEKKRISLGMKQLTPHPWDSLPADIQAGSRVKGKVVNVADYGAFVELMPGVEGLIHVSEMSWSQHLRNPQDFLKTGDEVEAVVLAIDREERKMSLGLKQLTEDPWTRQDILTKYAPGTRHTGIVRNLTNFGLFLELEEGIDGLVHVSDLSWTRKIKHPSEFTKVGEKLEVVVLELDVNNRRLALSHKHLEENPWDTFETIFTPGSVHKGTIINKADKGLVVELPYGIEGLCSSKNAVKQDGTRPEIGETLDFKVLDFSKDERKVVLSHKATYSSEAEEKPATKKARQPKAKTIDKINQEVEKSTLGDLEALSALKQKLDNSAGEGKTE
jgi:small subunit ribosomal protein S1